MPLAPPPVVGVTTYLEQAQTGVWDVRAAFLPEVYLSSVTEAGGIPVLLPPQPVTEEIADRVLDRIDALVLSGGADVDPALYGQEPHAETGRPRADRDSFERMLVVAALRRGLPVLAICRGAQLLNVALGGTLHQHLPEVVGSDRYRPAPAEFGVVDVSVTPGSHLARVVGPGLTVHSYHHQAVDAVADGLVVTASSDDGVVQAVELAGAAFALGVQWHPEQDAADRRLFHALVRAAGERAGERAGDTAPQRAEQPHPTPGSAPQEGAARESAPQEVPA